MASSLRCLRLSGIIFLLATTSLSQTCCRGFIFPSAPIASPSALRAASALSSSKETFQNLGLAPEILSAIQAAHPEWESPTPVQSRVLQELLLPHHDNQESVTNLSCLAPTGAGKTAAYALPLLHKLLLSNRQDRNDNGGKIRSLILCPTRELALQIQGVFETLAKHISQKRQFRILTLTGGTPRGPQIAALADALDREDCKIDVLIATPGRLVDLLEQQMDASDAVLEQRLLETMAKTSKSTKVLQNHHRVAPSSSLLKGLDYLILDEGDRLLGRGFESEMEAVLNLLLPAKTLVGTWLFSATLAPQMEPRVHDFLRRIHGDTTEMPPLIRITCGNDDSEKLSSDSSDGEFKSKHSTEIQEVGLASTIDLRTIRVDKRHRTMALRQLLLDHADWDRVLVFVATRYAAEHVSRKLRRAGIASTELHGKLDQEMRSQRLDDLKMGKVRVLLATDLASRGLDIVGLPAVVQYDLPRSTVDFMHRVGRTGRAGRRGSAVTFCTPESEAHLDLIEARHLSMQQVVRETLPGLEPDEAQWRLEAEASRVVVPGTNPSEKGLAHDRMFGGIKGRRKSKKDKLREQAAKAAAQSRTDTA